MVGDLTNPAVLRDILKKYRLWAKKRFGQNFLVDRSVLDDIVRRADVGPEDFIVEVGPGPGVLTRELLARAKRVMVIEIDNEIIPVLKETTHFYRDKLEIEHSHVLYVPTPSQEYKVVANIPYHLTSPILRKYLVEAEKRPVSMTLLVQKEVAEKICNTKKKSILSLFVEVFGNAEIVRIVPSQSFFPPPKVDSAVLHIDVSPESKISIHPKLFFQAVKMGFHQPRKKIKNNLPSHILEKAEIDVDLRAESLSIDDWVRVTEAMASS